MIDETRTEDVAVALCRLADIRGELRPQVWTALVLARLPYLDTLAVVRMTDLADARAEYHAEAAEGFTAAPMNTAGMTRRDELEASCTQALAAVMPPTRQDTRSRATGYDVTLLDGTTVRVGEVKAA